MEMRTALSDSFEASAASWITALGSQEEAGTLAGGNGNV